MVDSRIQSGEGFRRRLILQVIRAGIHKGERELIQAVQVLFVDVLHSGSQEGV
mgnify:CR=1 FL=1